MDINDTHLYGQAITFALNGQKEQAYDLFKHLNLRNSSDSNLTFWRIFTAPDLKKAEGLFNMVKLNDPNNIILVEAEHWLNTRKAGREVPSGGYSRFPPRLVGTIANPIANNLKPEYFPPMMLERYQPEPVLQIPITIGMSYRCSHCGSVVPPITQRRTSKGGWVALVILLILFFPICWIGLLQKESYQICGQCKAEL